MSANNRKQFSALNEIDAGILDGYTYDEIADLYTDEFEKRQQNKAMYRYPEGRRMKFTEKVVCDCF